MFDRDVTSNSYCSTSPSWHIGGNLLNSQTVAGHIATWNSENPDQVIEVGDRIVSLNDAWPVDVTNASQFPCEGFGYLTTCHCCFFVPSLAHTLVQNKNMWRIAGGFPARFSTSLR